MPDYDWAVIPVQVENTPAATDPVGTDEYYRTLGMTMMALGRLEGQFSVALLTLMNLPGCETLGFVLPIAWKRRAEMWRQAFQRTTELSLSFYRDNALALLIEIMDVMQDRHALSHAIWEGFVPGAGLTVATLHVKHKKGTTDGLDVVRHKITIDMLRAILRKANQLNQEMIPLSLHLCSLRPAPPGVRRV